MAYITGKGRYDNYTSRYDVYLFTLRDYVELLLRRYNGRYINRSDMPIHSGYLLEFVDIDKATEFILAASESHEDDGDITTYVLPHTDGNELPVYATTKKGVNAVYIGLSEYKEALDRFEQQNPTEELVAPTLTAMDPDFDLWGTPASALQDNVEVNGTVITGQIKYLAEGALVDQWGAGNFIALQALADDWTQYTSVKIGMNPSEGSGLVDIINDPDKNGAFKITDKDTQKFVVEATNGVITKRIEYDLSELELASEA